MLRVARVEPRRGAEDDRVLLGLRQAERAPQPAEGQLDGARGRLAASKKGELAAGAREELLRLLWVLAVAEAQGARDLVLAALEPAPGLGQSREVGGGEGADALDGVGRVLEGARIRRDAALAGRAGRLVAARGLRVLLPAGEVRLPCSGKMTT